MAYGIPTATPGINQHTPLDRLTHCPAKQTNKQTKQPKKLNNKQGTEKKHAAEGVGCSKCTREEGRERC
jgi:hypothetical protein